MTLLLTKALLATSLAAMAYGAVMPSFDSDDSRQLIRRGRSSRRGRKSKGIGKTGNSGSERPEIGGLPPMQCEGISLNNASILPTDSGLCWKRQGMELMGMATGDF